MGHEAAASANRALTLALSTLLRLFAPFLPFVTEEVWSWWQEGSIHRAAWPEAALRAAAGESTPEVLDVAGAVLSEVRKAKTTAKQSLRAEVARATVRAPARRLAALKEAEADLCYAGNIRALLLAEGEGFDVAVELAAAG
jgi:valyl-tRNA synthetase